MASVISGEISSIMPFFLAFWRHFATFPYSFTSRRYKVALKSLALLSLHLSCGIVTL